MPENNDESIGFNPSDSREILYKCSQCDTSFSDNYNLSEHMKTHIVERIYKCSQCDKAFTKNCNLKRHARMHKFEKSYQCDKNISENGNLVEHTLAHICNLCDKSFSRKSNLMRHMRSHTGERQYQCSQCDKAFLRSFDLVKHRKNHHGENPYQCTQCDKSFSKYSILTIHMRTHTGEKPYLCSHCGKAFTNKSALQRHMKSHEEEKTYQCSLCDRAFSENSAFVRHMVIHTDGKPIECSQCAKVFSSKSNLSRHMRIHTREKPYKCSQCEETFSKKGVLTVHIRDHTGEKSNQCSQCDHAFTQKCLLKKHIKRHSTKCIQPGCKEYFYHHKDLNEHLRLSHNSDLHLSQHTFMSMNDFLTWKEAEETKNFIYYSKKQATKEKKSASYMYYSCQKSGSSRHHYKKGEVHRKSSRRNKKGVVKTDLFCPSKLKCKLDQLTGVITVTYIQTHNHQINFQDTQHHPIPRSIIEKVKLRLISGSSPKEIFKDLKKENSCASQEKNIQQKHISIRSIKKIEEKLKSQKDIEYHNQEKCQEGSSIHEEGICISSYDIGKVNDNIDYQNQKIPQEEFSNHETGISNVDVEVVKVSENTWNIKSYTRYTNEDPTYYVIEFVMPYCGDYSCSEKCHKLSCIGLCSHMYHCSCLENHNLCSHIHKVHSSRNQNSQAPNIIASEVVANNDTDSNNDEQFNNIADISEEYYEESRSEPASEIALRTTILKSMENIHNHLNDDKYRSLYLNRVSTVLEQLNSEIEAIKSNNKTGQDKFDQIFTEL